MTEDNTPKSPEVPLKEGMRVSVVYKTKRQSKGKEPSTKSGVIAYVNRKFKWANVKIDDTTYVESHFFDSITVLS